MLPLNNTQNALRSINQVLVLARKMAVDSAALTDMADVLDVAEHLPRLLADSHDTSVEFRACLGDLASRWPQFGVALESFDDGSLAWPW